MEEEKQEELSAEQIWDEEANKSAEENLEASPGDSEETVVAEEPQETESKNEVEANANTQTEEDKPADPFEGLPEAVKQKLLKIDDLEKSNQQLIHHVKTAEGRVAAMQREAEIAKRVKDEVAKKDSPSQKEITNASKNPEKWDNLKEDFPEWAEAMEEFVASKLGSSQPQGSAIDPKQIEGYVNNRISASQSQLSRRIEEATLDGRHPSWRDDVKTTDFNNWLTNQPNEVRGLADSQNAKDAIRMMDLFYESKTRPADNIKQSRSQRLAKAATPDKRNQTPPPKSLEDMTPEQLWNYEAKKREKTRVARGY
jgi:hypothetical protein